MKPTAGADYTLAPNNNRLGHIPGDYGMPLLGKTFPLFKDPCGTYERHHLKNGRTSKMSVNGIKTLLLVGPEHAQDLFMDSQKRYSSQMGWSGFMGDFFQGGVLMRDFDEHRIQRRIMQSAFKNQALKHYVAGINQISQQSIHAWQQQQQITAFNEVKLLLLRIAFEVFCYTRPDSEELPRINQAFIDMLEATTAIIRKDWPGLLYRRGMNGRRTLYRFFKSLVEEKRAGNSQDMMSHFCRETKENGDYFNDVEIAEHMIFLMLAAHDTTASVTTMALYYLAAHPEWQEKLHQEANNLSQGEARYEDVFNGMPDTQLVLHETLRLHPAVSTTYRRTIRDSEIDGHFVPAHTMLTCPIQYNHRMQEYWQQPNDFRPERFGETVAEHKQHPFLWTPFGGGAHKCIGMHFAELLFKTTMANLLREHRVSFARGNYYPARIDYLPFTKPHDGLSLRVEKR